MTATKTAPIWLDFDAIDAACDARGATTDEARALVLGVNKSTLSRWKRGHMDITLGRALDIAERLDLPLQDIITASTPRPSAPPPGPRPPAGPSTPAPPPGPRTDDGR